MNNKGYIPISRKLFEHELWSEKREFSRAEAWIDLLRSVRFEANSTSVLIGNQSVELFAGEMIASLRYLGSRWGWSKHKVDSFLGYLIKSGMVTKRTPSGTQQTVITLCNYDSYNISKAESGTDEGTPRGHRGDTTGTKKNKVNKVNNIILSDNNICASDFEKVEPDQNPPTIPNPPEKEKSCAKKEKPPDAKFIKPTLQEVGAYCRERGNSVQPEKFMNFYDSNGWRVGRNPMKDWRAAVRTWEGNGYSQQKNDGNENTRTSNERKYGSTQGAKDRILARLAARDGVPADAEK